MNRYLPVSLTTAVQLVTALAALTIPTVVPLVDQTAIIATTRVGSFISTLYAAAALITLGAGEMIRRWGPVRVNQLSLLACALGLFAAAEGSPVAVFLAAIGLGIGYGPITPASSALLAATTNAAHRRLIFSLKQSGVPAGAALAGLIVPAMMISIGWRTTLQVLGGICAITALALQGVRVQCDRLVTHHQASRPLRLFQSLTLIGGDPNLRQLAAVAFVLGGAQMCISTFVVSYFYRTLNSSPYRESWVARACRFPLAWLRVKMSLGPTPRCSDLYVVADVDALLGHCPITFSCLIQRGAFFFALMAS